MRMPFVIRTDADFETLRRITGTDIKRVEWELIHIEQTTVEPMKPVELRLPRIPYAERLNDGQQ